ncbi:MAG: DeoR/GlpR transcriptional regulator [Clostridia bacterium]|nr:DeoR/GlpR transcriptional regulator [Clostridia bacterium]
MGLKEREQAILDYLNGKKEASVNELCNALFVSKPTMRRDLASLSLSGKIIRTHGGAMIRNQPGENIPLSLREREHSDAKLAIAKKCLSLIRDGDTVMLDGSTSALALIKLLDGKKSIIVITNSAKAAQILAETKIKAFITGGELQPDSCAHFGSYAENFVRGFNADICFFSVRRLTHDGKLTDNAINENSIRKVMLNQSRRSVLMIDSQKVGEPCSNTLCSLADITYAVSERDLRDDFPAFADKFI